MTHRLNLLATLRYRHGNVHLPLLSREMHSNAAAVASPIPVLTSLVALRTWRKLARQNGQEVSIVPTVRK